jgi:hypothetical protein
MGLVPLLLPFVWVLELDSCGHPVPLETELTGVTVMGKFEVEGWMVVVPVLLVVVLIPFLAPRVQRLGARVLLHALGVLATLFAGWGAVLAMLFTIFTDRTPRGLGWVVLGAFAASIVDAGLRFVWSLQEWLRARALAKTQPAASP